MNLTYLKLNHHKSNLIITITPRRHMNTKHTHNTQTLTVHTQREKTKESSSSSSGSSSSSSGTATTATAPTPTSTTAAASTSAPRLLHESRASNNGGPPVQTKPRLKLPPGSSPLWKELDQELEARLGLEFTQRDVDAKSTAELADRIVYDAMAGRFEGKKEAVAHEERKKPPNPRLEEFRALKKELRKPHRALLRSGGKGSEAERVLNKRWFEVVQSFQRS